MAIAFWTNVVLLHHVLTDCCPLANHGAGAPDPVLARAKPANGPLPEAARDCALGRFYVDEDLWPQSPESELSRSAVRAGMNEVEPLIDACHRLYKVPGSVHVNIVIAKSGRVSSAKVRGSFSGTPMGECVEEMVRTACFPPSGGLTTLYPFQLR